MNLDLGYTRQIIQEGLRYGLPRKQLAYALASCYWESARTMEPVEEGFYLRDPEAHRKRLRYYPWHGRGLIQLTHESNYIRAGKELGLDLTTDKDTVMEPGVAVKIAVRGMAEGWFTGRKLADYISRDKADYRAARQIVNGRDKDRAIAILAQDYETALAREGIGDGASIDTQRPLLRPGSKGAFVYDLQTQLVELGYNLGRIDGHFGRATRDAVLAFQADHGLDTDGVAGAQTWGALERAKKKPARAIDEAELRKRGSRTIAEADEAEQAADDGAKTTQTLTAAAVGVGGWLGTPGAADRLAGAETAAQKALGLLQTYWPLLLVAGIAWLALTQFKGIKSGMSRIREIRTDDAQSGANMQR